ncbi:MAG: NAD+ synthase, partial [Candidatus Eisenbacteria bacterium]|nr:NAD+ synthase [Candidatus Eisenbacteria bacterium]
MTMRIAIAQINPTVGALEENTRKIIRHIELAFESQADLVAFPELAVTGYPPEDLLLKPSFLRDVDEGLDRIRRATPNILACVGLPRRGAQGLHNAAALLFRGRLLDTFHKGTLPNYGVFDEKRYFTPSVRCPVYTWRGKRFAVNICEDLWVAEGVPRVQVQQGGAGFLINISSSPYDVRKGALRETLMQHRARRYGVPILHVNQVGGQDELVFDGRSVLVSATGEVLARARSFEEDLLVADLDWGNPTPAPARAEDEAFTNPPAEHLDYLEQHLYVDAVKLPDGDAPPRAASSPAAPRLAPAPEDNASLYRALVLGLGDYVRKNGFRSVVIGLSGGADSALTAVLAVDALGPEAVIGIAMPSAYSASESLRDACELADNLGIRVDVLPIGSIFDCYRDALAEPFRGLAEDVTEENIQARIRGNLLMAYSNKFGALVLATGNKSEMAVGYCTLYGDLAGGFAVLKDVFKT